MELQIIAHIESDFPEKFGIPRQSGLAPTRARVVFLPQFRQKEAFRGLAGFSHVWLLWLFSENKKSGWQATVRPPRLGGNTRLGVFATRSPYRPNPIGLSCVRLLSVSQTERGPELEVEGADLMDGTPIVDVKPYLPYADAHPEATGGFTENAARQTLQVDFPSELLSRIPEEKRQALLSVLAEDPRPSYQEDQARVYGVSFAGFNVRFTVSDGILRVCDTERLSG
ncbi:MAG: tRNA (N6-threonylcarbamoyladenosine(37)-N6)-methyltransferase TrmO [Clostridiales bacterium]|nr:tRNA (N6-threonylcarbamoyladenosine(37)-N6)-methyltransferase TrmO [Clostridiales bacterium]